MRKERKKLQRWSIVTRGSQKTEIRKRMFELLKADSKSRILDRIDRMTFRIPDKSGQAGRCETRGKSYNAGAL
jgi:hypothetical protein